MVHNNAAEVAAARRDGIQITEDIEDYIL